MSLTSLASGKNTTHRWASVSLFPTLCSVTLVLEIGLRGSIYTTRTCPFCLSPCPQQHFLSVWPECGPQPRNDSGPLEEKQKLFIQKPLSLASCDSRGWGQRNCYSLKGFHSPHLLVCWLLVVCKISNSVSPINRTDRVSFLTHLSRGSEQARAAVISARVMVWCTC